jgi:arylformamidase
MSEARIAATSTETAWRELGPDEIRRQFDMRVAVPEGQGFTESFLRRSEAARARLVGARDLRYGPLPRQVLDVFPAAAACAPVAMFWHGGGWRYQSKEP